MTLGLVYALIGVGLSAGLGAIGSSIGSGSVAKVGASLLSKEPKKFAQVLILSALPSSQALYGLLFAFIILVQTGLLSGDTDAVTTEIGLSFLAASIPVSFASLFSGISQGKVAASGMQIINNNSQNLIQAIVLAALIESFAIFGLVISILVAFIGIQL